MNRFKSQPVPVDLLLSSPSGVPTIGRLAGGNGQGEVLIEFEGSGPLAAKLVAGLERRELCKPENRGREVLLVFEKGDPARPIVLALMEDRLEGLICLEPREEEGSLPEQALVDGRRVLIEAEQEIVLKCGKGSIQILKDGKIIIKGTDLLSRSSGTHRIKGASVNIN
jgi:Domain of unknown function (DUF6484)